MVSPAPMTPSELTSTGVATDLETVSVGVAGATGTLTIEGVTAGSVPLAGVPVAVAVLSIVAKAGVACWMNNASARAETLACCKPLIALDLEFREVLGVMMYSVFGT